MARSQRYRYLYYLFKKCLELRSLRLVVDTHFCLGTNKFIIMGSLKFYRQLLNPMFYKQFCEPDARGLSPAHGQFFLALQNKVTSRIRNI